MFAAIMARQEASEEKREAFRIEIRTRFDRGSKRMDEQDSVLEEIREHARKTNGRVTRLEDADITRRINTLELAETAIRTELARFKGALWVIGGLLGILQAVGITLLSNYLNS
jgi:hypothetical protein